MRRVLSIAATSLPLLIVGCAGAEVPAQKVTDSRAAIRAAEEVGAKQHPQAALHLELARDQVALAQNLIDEDEKCIRLTKRGLDVAEAVVLPPLQVDFISDNNLVLGPFSLPCSGLWDSARSLASRWWMVLTVQV